MASIPPGSGLEYLLCLARSERDADMQGYAVRLSAFVVNVLVAILIAWSNESVTSSVNTIMLQAFTILVASAVATSRDGLSIADAHFSITITASPLAIYFLYSGFRFLRKRPNHLYSRIDTPGKQYTTLGLSIALLIWWIVFDLLIYFSTVFESPDCPLTLQGWLVYKLFTGTLSLEFSRPLLPVPIVFWVIYLLRHFKDIRGEYRRHMANTRPWQHFRWVQTTGRAIKYFVIAQWDVITRSHKWLFLFTICVYYLTWGNSLMLTILDTHQAFRGLAEAIDPDVQLPPAEEWDPLNYGQLLAAAVAVEPLWQVLKLTFFKRHELWQWIITRPRTVIDEVVFIITGRRNPWKRLLEKEEHRRSLRFLEGGKTAMQSMDQVHLLYNESGEHGQRFK
ncbi:hypothetical protein AAF712_005455 [Marasmius tenuissimus]|uniref:Uncharacterized protein n=1 Tax=Marasmius tenuissimus TaxID=585030 RepID=A0ABR3A4J7_9AGAR